jgi:hypothetical protein
MSNQQDEFKERNVRFNECVRSLRDEVLQLVSQAERPGIAVSALTHVLVEIISNCYTDPQQTLRLVVGEFGRLTEEYRKACASESTTTENSND